MIGCATVLLPGMISKPGLATRGAVCVELAMEGVVEFVRGREGRGGDCERRLSVKEKGRGVGGRPVIAG